MGDKWTTSGRSRLKAMQKRKNFPVGPVRNRPTRVDRQPPRIPGKGKSKQQNQMIWFSILTCTLVRGSYSEYADPIFRHGIGVPASDDGQERKHPTQHSTRPRIRDANRRRILAHYNPNYDPRTDRVRPSAQEYEHEQIQERRSVYSRPPPSVRPTPSHHVLEPPRRDYFLTESRVDPAQFQVNHEPRRAEYMFPRPGVGTNDFGLDTQFSQANRSQDYLHGQIEPSQIQDRANPSNFQMNHDPRRAEYMFSRPEVGTDDVGLDTLFSQAGRSQDYLHGQIEPSQSQGIARFQKRHGQIEPSQSQGIARFQKRPSHKDDVFYVQTPESFQEQNPILLEQQTRFECQSFPTPTPTHTQGLSRYQRSNVSLASRDDRSFHGGLAGDFMPPPQNVQYASANFRGSDPLSSHIDQNHDPPIGQGHGIARFSRRRGTSDSSATFASCSDPLDQVTPPTPGAYQAHPHKGGIDRFKRKPSMTEEAAKEEPIPLHLANTEKFTATYQDDSVPPTEQSILTDQRDSVLTIETTPIRFFDSSVEVDSNKQPKQPMSLPGSESDDDGGSLMGMRGRKSLWG